MYRGFEIKKIIDGDYYFYKVEHFDFRFCKFKSENDAMNSIDDHIRDEYLLH